MKYWNKGKLLTKICSILVLCFTSVSLTSCQQKILDPSSPIAITIWTYYINNQLDIFNNMVKDFNDTKGREMGIYVESTNFNGITDVEKAIANSVSGETGAKKMPDIFSSYPSSAFMVDQKGLVADLDDYLSKEEISEYVEAFMDEGIFEDNGKHKIFPIAKSTDILFVNKTEWDRFSSAIINDSKFPQLSEEDFKTWEGIKKISASYYRWTDDLTPEIKNDGRAFFGMDSVSNFLYLAAEQLGLSMVSVKNGEPIFDLNKEVLKKVWDLYFGMHVKGYITAISKYRASDMTTGDLMSYVGSSGGGVYFPPEIMHKSGQIELIEPLMLPYPTFEGAPNITLQRGAGMVVCKSDKKREYASIEFLKWFTEESRNLQFAIDACYSPVKKSALESGFIENTIEELKQGDSLQINIALVFEVVRQQMDTHTSCIMPPFNGSSDFTDKLNTLILDQVEEGKARMIKHLDAGLDVEQAYLQIGEEELFEKWYSELMP